MDYVHSEDSSVVLEVWVALKRGESITFEMRWESASADDGSKDRWSVGIGDLHSRRG